MSESPPGQLGLAARTLLDLDHPELARAVLAVALDLEPGLGNLHSVMAGVLEALGDPAAAIVYWRKAARLMPGSPQQQLNLALALLGRGDYAAGFAQYEARRDKADWVAMATGASMAAATARRLRPGDPVSGRSIVVVTEQGLGDAIMFARYLPMLAERIGPGQLTVVCKAALRPLFEAMHGIGTVMAPPPEQPLARINLAVLAFDAWIPLMSLPLWFATTPATVPPPIRLPADPAAVAAWRARYDAAGRPGRRRIGLVFRANPESASAADRSMAVADLLALAEPPGIDLVNLQPGPEGRALTAAIPAMIEAMADPMPLDEFAAAVAATDLLITVDTMAAHCAAALAHPTWVALPHAPHWFWGETGPTTPWYPQARLFRQPARRDWRSVVAAIAGALG